MHRLRAKIQNDFKLFLADLKVQAKLANLSKEVRAQLASRGQLVSRIIIYIFADESAKTDDYLVFGSFWIYTESGWVTICQKFRAWRTFKTTTKEFSFKETRKHDAAKLTTSFLKELLANSPFKSFTALCKK
jgi:hypothetical protein